MAITCVVQGCKSNNAASKIRFFSYPAVRKHGKEEIRKLSKIRQERWLNVCPVPKVSSTWRICGKHFVGGCPAELEDVDNVDWVPSLLLQSTPTVLGNAESAGQSSCESRDAPSSTPAVELIAGGVPGCGVWPMHVGRDHPANDVVSSVVSGSTGTGSDEERQVQFQQSLSGNSQTYDARCAPTTAVFAPLERSDCVWTEEDESDQANSTCVSDESIESMPFDTVDETGTDSNVTSDWQWLTDLVPEPRDQESDDFEWMIEDTLLDETDANDVALAEEMDWTFNSMVQTQQLDELDHETAIDSAV